jgi:hypothetical protein
MLNEISYNWKDYEKSGYPFFKVLKGGKDSFMGKYWFEDEEFLNKGSGIKVGTIFDDVNAKIIKHDDWFYFCDRYHEHDEFAWCHEIHKDNLRFNTAAKNKYLFKGNSVQLPL